MTHDCHGVPSGHENASEKNENHALDRVDDPVSK